MKPLGDAPKGQAAREQVAPRKRAKGGLAIVLLDRAEKAERALEQERAAHRATLAALKEMRWVQPTYNGSPSCAYCGQQKHLHTEPCGVDAILAQSQSGRS